MYVTNDFIVIYIDFLNSPMKVRRVARISMVLLSLLLPSV